VTRHRFALPFAGDTSSQRSPVGVREVVDLLHPEDLDVEGEGGVLVGDRDHDRRHLPDVRAGLGHPVETPQGGGRHRSTPSPSSVGSREVGL
jgi:hypothetical protein